MTITPAEAAAKLREAREAAERLLKFYDYPNGGSLIAYRDMTPGEAACAFANDVLEVSKATLEQNPADDEEAITPEWLVSIGFDDVNGCMAIQAGQNKVAFLRSVQEFFINGLGVYGITTRRQLRQLLAGLGGTN